MESNRSVSFILYVVFFIILMGFPASSTPTTISGGVFESRGFNGRTLLQAKKGCPVNFEFMNYTVITSKCKGPKYLPDPCCSALTEFACPHAAELNDLTNDCASTMFSYINLYGKYPPGLFANECQGNKEGLPCPAAAPAQSASDTNWSQIVCRPSLLLMLTSGFILYLFQFSHQIFSQ